MAGTNLRQWSERDDGEGYQRDGLEGDGVPRIMSGAWVAMTFVTDAV